MKKKWLFWLPVGAAAIWAGSHLLPGFGHFGPFGGHDMIQGGQGHGMMQGGSGQGMMQGGSGQSMVQGGQGHGMMQSGSPGQSMMQGGHSQDMMGHGGGKHNFGFDFGWGKTLIGVGIALFGVAIRKNARDNAWKKWAGYGLIGVGLVTAFKAAVPILAIGAGAYWLFKKANSPKQKGFSGPFAYASAPVVNNNSQLLDAWEKDLYKEEK